MSEKVSESPPAAAAMPAVTAMSNPVRDYDWGSVTALAQLQGREPHGGPEAELWMGTHPSAPSSVRIDGDDVPLPDLLAGLDLPPLPFLLKILAIAGPLSVQVHPSAERAAQMYGRPGSPYVDAAHKPELLYALAPSQALFGFRPLVETVALLEPLDAGRLAPLLADLAKAEESEESRLGSLLERLVTWPQQDRAALVAELAGSAALAIVAGGGPGTSMADDVTVPAHASAYKWVSRLIELHPTDPMVLAPIVLQLYRLRPGDTVYVPAGAPHCYLDGLGVEIMAASDNVLRAGLTAKPIETGELLAVLDSRPGSAPPAQVSHPQSGETAWRVPVPDFQLVRADVAGTLEATPLAGPQIVLCVSGSVTVSAGGASVPLTPGTSAFVLPDAGDLVFEGEGQIFRAAANPPPATRHP